MRYLKWLAIAAVIIVLITVVTQCSKLPKTLPEGSVSAKWLELGFYDVGSFNVNVQDKSRKIEGAKKTKLSRRFIGKLWFPMIEEGLVAPGQHPLIIYVHRYGGSHGEFSLQAELLASRGYLVLAANSPTAQSNDLFAVFAAELPAQAADIRFLLDTISQWNTSPETLFYSRVDLNRVGIVGRSIGAITALNSSFHPQLKDERISLTAIIGGVSRVFSKQFFADKPKQPLLAIAGTNDNVADYMANAVGLIEKHHNSWLISIKDGRHSGFSETAKRLSWLGKTETVNCETLTGLLHSNDWAQQLDTKDQGLIAPFATSDCNAADTTQLKTAAQLHLSQLGLTAFIEMHFADTQFERTAAADFLSQTFALENPELHYTAPIK